MTLSYLDKMLNNILVEKKVIKRKPEPVIDYTDKPTGFALPDGARLGPNCGVTAVAIVCKLTFHEAWHMLRNGRNANWKGKTFVSDWIQVFQKLGIKHDQRMVTGMTLERWMKTYARPGVTYMARTTGHVQVVKDGWCIDQMGAKPIANFWGRRKRITHIIEIMES